jgi:outer membrane scaffolding protein for murein synthesis (MipA/OmpV family)
MKNRTVLATIIIGVFTAFLAYPLHVRANSGELSLGLGAGIAPEYIGSDDYVMIPMIYGKMSCPGRSSYVEFEGLTEHKQPGLKLRANVVNHDHLIFGPLANYRLGRDDALSIDDHVVEKMASVDDSLELGAFLGLVIHEWTLMAEVFQDVSDGHEGLLFTLSGKYVWDFSPSWDLIIGGSTTWADDDYMSSFFDVDPRDSMNSGLPLYDADDSQWRDVSCDLGAIYYFSDEWKIRLSAGYTRLLSDAKNSPVTDDRGDQSQYFAGIMAIYTFW